MKCRSAILSVALLLLISQQAYGQSSALTDSVFTPVKEHSADRALMYSLIPGGGQIYNRQAWKVPIIYGAFAGMGYLIYFNYDKMVDFRDEYLYRVNHDEKPQLAGYENYPRANIYNMYQSYNKNFQLMIIITAGIYGLNLIDAYVFGHLFDFQMDDNIALTVSPTLQPMLGMQSVAPGLGLKLTF